MAKDSGFPNCPRCKGPRIEFFCGNCDYQPPEIPREYLPDIALVYFSSAAPSAPHEGQGEAVAAPVERMREALARFSRWQDGNGHVLCSECNQCVGIGCPRNCREDHRPDCDVGALLSAPASAGEAPAPSALRHASEYHCGSCGLTSALDEMEREPNGHPIDRCPKCEVAQCMSPLLVRCAQCGAPPIAAPSAPDEIDRAVATEREMQIERLVGIGWDRPRAVSFVVGAPVPWSAEDRAKLRAFLESRDGVPPAPVEEVGSVEQEAARAWDSLDPACAHCGKPAACVGEYEDCTGVETYACEECCGHGNEGGHCRPIDIDVDSDGDEWGLWSEMPPDDRARLIRFAAALRSPVPWNAPGEVARWSRREIMTEAQAEVTAIASHYYTAGGLTLMRQHGQHVEVGEMLIVTVSRALSASPVAALPAETHGIDEAVARLDEMIDRITIDSLMSEHEPVITGKGNARAALDDLRALLARGE